MAMTLSHHLFCESVLDIGAPCRSLAMPALFAYKLPQTRRLVDVEIVAKDEILVVIYIVSRGFHAFNF